MLLHHELQEEVSELSRSAAEGQRRGDDHAEKSQIGRKISRNFARQV